MPELLWLFVLLLPVAAASGWFAARRSYRRRAAEEGPAIPEEYIQGLNYLLNEQRDKALEVFIRLVEVDSNTIETHLVLGTLFRRRGEVERAIRIHQNLIARPDLESSYQTQALLELGRDYLAAGLLDRAEELFKEVIGMGQQVAEAYRRLREIYEQEKDWDSAIEAAVNLQNAAGKSQAHVIAQYYCEIGEASAAAGETPAAVQMAKKALAYDRDCVRASILLGDLAFGKGDYKSAIRHYGDVHAQDPDFLPVILPKLKAVYEQTNEPEGYTQFLRELLSRHDRNTALILSLIESLARQGDDQAVERLFEARFSSQKVPLEIVREYIRFAEGGAGDPAMQARITAALDAYLGNQASHLCSRCGFRTKTLFWRCPGCHGWGSVKPVDHAVDVEPPAHFVQ